MKLILVITGTIAAVTAVIHKLEKRAGESSYSADFMDVIPARKMGFYEKYLKRGFDICCALVAIICFSWLYAIVALLVKLRLGSPVLFTQDRPGLIGEDGKETIFKMYKFRTMTDARDGNGELLPDEVRLTKFGKWLRSTSLDELPEAFNILNGTMSVIGPRPQLVCDMVFMTSEQRLRHTAKPGLSGLAQINGRNEIDWEDKLNLDLKYIQHVSFVNDIKIIIKTVGKAFIKKEGITEKNMATAQDFGDYLLKNKKIEKKEYEYKMQQARDMVKDKICENDNQEKQRIKDVLKSSKEKKYSVLMSVYKNERPDFLQTSIESMINQTVPPEEIVLVEDGPLTDELYNIIDLYKKHLKIIINKTNLGLGLALNKGLKECKNELVARMDTDDISKVDRCEKQLKYFLNKPYLAIVGAQIDEFAVDPSNIVSQRKVPLTSEKIYNYAKKRSAFNHPVVMYSKTAVLNCGGYSNLKRNQDVDLFGRMLYKGYKAENIDESLLLFRTSKELSGRRKSWENTSSYILTIKNFWKMGYSSFCDVLIVMVAQIIMYLLPVKLQDIAYKIILRR